MRVALMGLGVVGKAFLHMLMEKAPEIRSKYGLNPTLVAVSDSSSSLYNEKGLDPRTVLEQKIRRGSLAGLADEVGLRGANLIKEVEAEVLIEATPSNFKNGEPGLSHIKAALNSGKHVITVNKGPLALEMPALIEMFRESGLKLLFSGTVGGGTPFVRFVRSCLVGERVLGIRGVLNGTTNYILTRMESGMSFEEALVEAQKLGYAEADPSNDIDGWDSAAKLVILSNLAMESDATLRDVEVSGIRGVEIGEELLSKGKTLRLIASADRSCLRVRTEAVERTDPLAVSGALNAVSFLAELSGRHTLVGKGAGGEETATAILRDLVELKMNLSGVRSCL
ncbi:MAG: homoserine dehydrogenase [Candidatus Korarchaeum sp.]|nr:homoserine dehydrogenase [Candidatus Korarchaeum sp.]MDW8035705.1 homoserine dehydrogenase [Candidatus Korarchaeum sp.]